jgi:hemoglobin
MKSGLRAVTRWVMPAMVCAVTSSVVFAQETKPSKSLYDRLGGKAAITAVVDEFVAVAAADPAVNFTRKGTAHEWQATPENVGKLKERLVQFLSMAFGATDVKYEGKDMKSAHAGMGITTAEFSAIAGDLKKVLEKLKVPQAEMDEVMAIAASTAKDIVEKP